MPLAELGTRRGVDQDRALRDLGVRLEARREVHGVADAGVGRALAACRCSRRPCRRWRCRCRSGSAACRRRALDVEQLDHLDHLERRARRRCRSGSGERQRRAEDRHQPVADHLVDDAAVAADRVEHQRVVGVEQLDRLLGRLRLDQRREAADVGEHAPSRRRAGRRARSPIAAGPARPRGVAKRRTSSFCWSRRRFFSRLAPMRALSSTGLTGLCR